jgi:hypothetical protein
MGEKAGRWEYAGLYMHRKMSRLDTAILNHYQVAGQFIGPAS